MIFSRDRRFNFETAIFYNLSNAIFSDFLLFICYLAQLNPKLQWFAMRAYAANYAPLSYFSTNSRNTIFRNTFDPSLSCRIKRFSFSIDSSSTVQKCTLRTDENSAWWHSANIHLSPNKLYSRLFAPTVDGLQRTEWIKCDRKEKTSWTVILLSLSRNIKYGTIVTSLVIRGLKIEHVALLKERKKKKIITHCRIKLMSYIFISWVPFIYAIRSAIS